MTESTQQPSGQLPEDGGAFTTTAEAWSFFARVVEAERSRLLAIAQQSLRARGVAWSASEAEDLVHDAVAHLVRHVDEGTHGVRPDTGLLIAEIRHRAQRALDSYQRRRTDPDPFDDNPQVDPTSAPRSPDEIALERLLLDEVQRRRETLLTELGALAACGALGRDQWEALRQIEGPDDDGPHPAAMRKRASRCRQTLRPVVLRWVMTISGAEPVEQPPAAHLSAILHGTGALRLSWERLTERAARGDAPPGP
jgi:DNA-directed RNA polymerase specialized sigma24 family protein